MEQFISLLWRVDYPLSLLILYLAFFIPAHKKKFFYIPLVIGIAVMFSFWQLLTEFPILKNNVYLAMLIYIVELLFFLVMIYFTIDVSFPSSALVMLLIVSLQHLSFKLSLQLLNFIDINIYRSPYYFICSYSFLIVTAIVAYFFYSRKLNEYIGYANLYTNMIAFGVVIIIVLFFSLYQQKLMFIENENRLLITTLFNFSNILITLLNILFLYIFAILQKRKQEALIISLMAQKEKERFELAQITVDEINIKYHDLKHMLQDNEAHINEEDLKEIKEVVTNYKAIIQTSNAGLNVVVYEAQLKCIKLGIDLNVLVDGDAFKDFAPHHIYSLMSNLLDNAIEATSEIEDKENRRIFLKIKTVRESIVLSLENYINKSPKMFKGVPISSKKDSSKHGYGLKSVKRIVDRYDGMLDYTVKDNKFRVTIVFPKKIHIEQ